MNKISKQKIAQNLQNYPITFISDIMKMSIKDDDNFFYFTKDGVDYIVAKYNIEIPQEGVGTELKKLLSKIGIKATENCSCNHRAKLLDMNGIEWCENNMETIIGWLKEESERRNLPFIEYVAKTLIKRAIKNYKKQINNK